MMCEGERSTTHLANSFESTSGELYSHHLSEGVGEKAFGVNVGEPSPPRLFL